MNSRSARGRRPSTGLRRPGSPTEPASRACWMQRRSSTGKPCPGASAIRRRPWARPLRLISIDRPSRRELHPYGHLHTVGHDKLPVHQRLGPAHSQCGYPDDHREQCDEGLRCHRILRSTEASRAASTATASAESSSVRSSAPTWEPMLLFPALPVRLYRTICNRLRMEY